MDGPDQVPVIDANSIVHVPAKSLQYGDITRDYGVVYGVRIVPDYGVVVTAGEDSRPVVFAQERLIPVVAHIRGL